jgi:hypothetical protein
VKAAQINDRQQFEDVMEQHTAVNNRLREVIIKLASYEPEVLAHLDGALFRLKSSTIRVQKHLDGIGDEDDDEYGGNDNNDDQNDNSDTSTIDGEDEMSDQPSSSSGGKVPSVSTGTA